MTDAKTTVTHNTCADHSDRVLTASSLDDHNSHNSIINSAMIMNQFNKTIHIIPISISKSFTQLIVSSGS